MAATLAGAATWQALRLSALASNDIWWHVRTGVWILQTHSIPRTGLFSQAPALPWIDSCWGFDLLNGIAVHLLGLRGVMSVLTSLQVAIAAALFVLAFICSRSFWPALLLSAIAQCCILLLQPRPAVCSVIFLAIELALLLQARRSDSARPLYWLPLLFVLWVNCDRQFSYGLAALGWLGVVELLERNRSFALAEQSRPGLPLGRVGLTTLACIAATFVSPYGWKLNALVWRSATHSAADRFFRELHSLRFRQPQDYLLLLLTMTAFFALGRRRSRDLFLIALLIASAAISFRIMRDNWLVMVVAVAIVSDSLRRGDSNGQPVRVPPAVTLISAALVLMLLAFVVIRIPGNDELRAKVSQTLPVQAADFVQQHHLPQPLFNTYEWGGFLTYALPEYPVLIDSRVDLYSEDTYLEYFKLLQGEIPLQSDSSFAHAQTFVLDVNSELATALSTLPDFRVLYRDNVAVVLVRSK